MDFSWLGPFVGALIGWITNVIAIEMLFRPKNPIYIANKRVPLTPGLISLNKNKIATVASEQVSSVILDSLSNTKSNSAQLELFNTLLDSYWVSFVFIGPHRREQLYNKLVKNFKGHNKSRAVLKNMIKEQILEYDRDTFEKTVRSLSNESLKGIKVVGALLGAVIGSLTFIL